MKELPRGVLDNIADESYRKHSRTPLKFFFRKSRFHHSEFRKTLELLNEQHSTLVLYSGMSPKIDKDLERLGLKISYKNNDSTELKEAMAKARKKADAGIIKLMVNEVYPDTLKSYFKLRGKLAAHLDALKGRLDLKRLDILQSKLDPIKSHKDQQETYELLSGILEGQAGAHKKRLRKKGYLRGKKK